MSGLRDEIRAILREEIAALGQEAQATPQPVQERVRIASSADLTRFAQDILARAADPDFAERLARGALCFELDTPRPAPMPASGPIVTPRTAPSPDVLEKPLVTERDIAALGGATRTLKLGRTSRLTPLARDEARRRGIRIERSET